MNEMHKIDALPALIIGRRDDSGVQTIYFDCSPWEEIYPALSEYRLEMSINGTRFAPLRQSYDNGLLTWTVSEQDTAVAGAGRYEITATGEDGQRKTSASATVYVDDRIPGTALGVPPDYVAPLLDRIAEIVAGAGGGNVSPEQIQQAVDSYLTANPIQENDPTVPDWAKQPGKPTYTAQEVGAMPADAEIVDNTARQGVQGNAEAISQLSEEKADKDEIPAPYTLPVASAETLGGVKIGHGLVMEGDVLSAAYDNFERVWENANVNATFSSQTIQLDLSDARAVCMIVRNSTSGSYYLSFGPFPKDVLCTVERNVETDVYTRKFTATDNGISFEEARINNTYLIPFIIWKLR